MNKYLNWLVAAVVTVVIVIFCLIWWFEQEDPYLLMKWWNQVIANSCNAQDERYGHFRLKDFHHKGVSQLHLAITANHDKILEESLSLMHQGGGVPMVDMDLVQSLLFEARGWKPLWVKFLNGWAPSADKLPTLKKIAASVPGITIMSVSVLHPGTVLRPHHGISRAVHRYHYGLKIPSGNLGLLVGDIKYRWKDREGVVWDDTKLHGVWNQSTEPRLVIFVDIKRDLGPIYNLGTDIIYWLISRSKDTQVAAGKLK